MLRDCLEISILILYYNKNAKGSYRVLEYLKSFLAQKSSLKGQRTRNWREPRLGRRFFISYEANEKFEDIALLLQKATVVRPQSITLSKVFII